MEFELQRREAADMEMVTARAGTTVAGELDLQSDFVLLHRGATNHALSPSACASPHAIRAAGGQIPGLDQPTGFLAQNDVVAHLTDPPGSLDVNVIRFILKENAAVRISLLITLSLLPVATRWWFKSVMR